MSVTLGRRTRARFDLPEVTLRRKSFTHVRYGAEIAASKSTGLPESTDVEMLPGGAWALRVGGAEELRLADYSDANLTSGDFDLAPGLAAVPMHRLFSGAGAGGDPGISASGVEALIKRVAVGTQWDAANLSADATAFPSPDYPTTPPYPLDRVMAGKTTYPANAGFGLMLITPEAWSGEDALLRLMFGGAAMVDPQDAVGGEFCLTLQGGGRAELHELDADGAWQPRKTMAWAEPGRAGAGIHVLHLRPHGRDRLALIGKSLQTPTNAFAGGSALATLGNLAFARPGSRHSALFWDQEHETGHRHRNALTGAGIVRVDALRTYRHPWKLFRLKHPETGVLVDAPFSISSLVPAGTAMTLHLDRYLLPETGLTGAIYDATTGTILATDGDGAFLTVTGQTQYFVKVTFTPTVDRFLTPILYGYEVSIGGEFVTRTTTPLVASKIMPGLSVSGPDLSPETETASFGAHDLFNAATLLRTRDLIHSDVVVIDGGGNVTSRLFEGLTSNTTAQLRGRPSATFTNWRDYRVEMVGMWERLAEQVPWSGDVPTFLQDRSAPLDDDGNRSVLPWRVVDVIRFLLNSCGVRDDEIDLPDMYESVRLWPGPGTSRDDYLVMPGGDQTYARLILRLAKDYLGAVLVRDPNAGARGKWRLLANPTYPYSNVVATYVATRPGGSAGKGGTHPGTYGAGTTFIETGSFDTWVRAPECNYVYVAGAGAVDSAGITHRAEAEWYNWVSHEFYTGQPIAADPTHPDFRGTFCPVYLCDPGLYGQEAATFAALRIAQVAGHAQKWVRWRSPLLLITDPLDTQQVYPRPPRVNDIVRVAGLKAILRSCSPDFDRSDRMQMATHTALFVE